MFAHSTTNTIPTAAQSSRSAGLASPSCLSRSVVTVVCRRPKLFGSAAASALAVSATSVRACAMVTPGFKRAISWTLQHCGLRACANAEDSQTSVFQDY